MHVASCRLLLTLLTGVAGAASTTWWTPPPPPRDAMADASNDLGLALLQDFVAAPGNVALSPLAAAATLVALWEGARGDTALQLRRALELPEDRDRVRAGFRDLHRLLRARHSQHQLWLSDLFLLSADAVPLEPAYVDVLRFYGYQLANATSTTNPLPQEPTTAASLQGETTQRATTPPSGSTTIVSVPPVITGNPGVSTDAVPGPATTVPVPSEITENPGAPTDAIPEPATTVAVPPNITENPGVPTDAVHGPMTTITVPPEITKNPGIPTDAVPRPTTVPPVITENPGVPTDAVPGPMTTIAVTPNITENPGVPTDAVPGPMTTVAVPLVITENPGIPTDAVPGPATTVAVPPVITGNPGASTDAVPGPATNVPVPAEITENPGAPTDAVPGLTITVPVPAEIMGNPGALTDAVPGPTTTMPVSPEITRNPGAPTDAVPGPATTVPVPPEITRNPGVPTDAVPGSMTTVAVPPKITGTPIVPTDAVAGPTTTAGSPSSVEETTGQTTSEAFTAAQPPTSPLDVPSALPPESGETPPASLAGTTTPTPLPQEAHSTTVPEATETPSALDAPSTLLPETTQVPTGDSEAARTTTPPPPGISIASEVPESSDTEPPRSRRAILGPSSRRLQGVEVTPFLVRGALQRLVPALRTSGRLPFARIKDLKACVLQVPIQDGSYRVLLVLPETPEDLPWTVAALRRFPLRHVVRRLRSTAVSVAVPLFNLHGVVLLTSTLQHLGVWDVFDPRRADLSCMSAATPLYVVNVAQRVDLDLRPRPLQASRGADAVEDAFVADRAFLFFVLDAVADVALLAGKVEDPLSPQIT